MGGVAAFLRPRGGYLRTVPRKLELGTEQRRDQLQRPWLRNDRASYLANPDSKALERRDGASGARRSGNRIWPRSEEAWRSQTTKIDYARLQQLQRRTMEFLRRKFR